MTKEMISRFLFAKARLHRAREENASLRTRLAALEAQLAARTGGEEALPDGEVQEVVSDLEYWAERLRDIGQPEGHGALKYAATILSALSPAPEAQQEPVAWMYAIEGYGPHVALEKPTPAPKVTNLRPLYTRPSEQAVTEAMVEAALKAWRNYATSGPVADDWSDAMRVALKAAMEARNE